MFLLTALLRLALALLHTLSTHYHRYPTPLLDHHHNAPRARQKPQRGHGRGPPAATRRGGWRRDGRRVRRREPVRARPASERGGTPWGGDAPGKAQAMRVMT
ncbi:hypothetical protein DFH08DRAFT_871455 [Mycena albidolilacea]|uniref:Uncharacterized protein n=1 Tax=Mycena albidolilacea TaxID=1033008 RepID=A0AAD7EQ25_9AGAR|nr:hypothetical protein DFH08DRAFT_871455 [Mycena albidolilacea]